MNAGMEVGWSLEAKAGKSHGTMFTTSCCSKPITGPALDSVGGKYWIPPLDEKSSTIPSLRVFPRVEGIVSAIFADNPPGLPFDLLFKVLPKGIHLTFRQALSQPVTLSASAQSFLFPCCLPGSTLPGTGDILRFY